MSDIFNDALIDKLESELTSTEKSFGKGDLIGGRFKVGKMIGRGNFGFTYLVQDSKDKQLYALKTIYPRLTTNPEAKQALSQNILHLSKVDHPSLGRVFHQGEHEDIFFFTMEYIKAPTLFDALKVNVPKAASSGAGIPRPQLDKIVTGIENGVSASGLLHFDLNPKNVFMTKDGAKVLDAGIFPALRPAMNPRDLSLLQMTEYMAPEVLDPKARADSRADVFSLGQLFYYILTLRMPRRKIGKFSIVGDDPGYYTQLIQVCLGPENRRFSSVVDAVDFYQGRPEALPPEPEPESEGPAEYIPVEENRELSQDLNVDSSFVEEDIFDSAPEVEIEEVSVFGAEPTLDVSYEEVPDRLERPEPAYEEAEAAREPEPSEPIERKEPEREPMEEVVVLEDTEDLEIELPEPEQEPAVEPEFEIEVSEIEPAEPAEPEIEIEEPEIDFPAPEEEPVEVEEPPDIDDLDRLADLEGAEIPEPEETTPIEELEEDILPGEEEPETPREIEKPSEIPWRTEPRETEEILPEIEAEPLEAEAESESTLADAETESPWSEFAADDAEKEFFRLEESAEPIAPVSEPIPEPLVEPPPKKKVKPKELAPAEVAHPPAVMPKKPPYIFITILVVLFVVILAVVVATFMGYLFAPAPIDDAALTPPPGTPAPVTPTPPPSVIEPAEKLKELIARADQYYKEKKWATPENENAIDLYHEILKLDAGHPKAVARLAQLEKTYINQGDSAFKAADYSKSFTLYERALRADPQSKPAQQGRAKALAKMQENKQTPPPTPTPAPTPPPNIAQTPMPTPQPTPAPPAATPAPGEGLSKAQIKGTIQAHWGKVKVCIGWGKQANPNMTGKCVVKFVIQPSGKVSNASVASSDLGDSKTEQCLVNRVLSMQFPAFSGSPMSVSFPFVVSQ